MSAEATAGGAPRPIPRGASKLAAARHAGLPAGAASAAILLLATLIAVTTLATGGRGAFLWREARAAARSDLATVGFRANVVHLQGASLAAQKEVLEAAAIRPGTPILDIDLAAVRARVERVGWVARASVIRLLPDTIVIAVRQRPLMAVWEHGGHAVVITDNGATASQADPALFGGLPLVVGAGADRAAATILPQVMGRPRLAHRLTALVRVDDRRWNLQLADGGVILLPAVGEAPALHRLDSLDRSARILDLGLARIDLRDPEMVVVRPRGAAAPALSGGGV
jgi:cell division protein FtsQ